MEATTGNRNLKTARLKSKAQPFTTNYFGKIYFKGLVYPNYRKIKKTNMLFVHLPCSNLKDFFFGQILGQQRKCNSFLFSCKVNTIQVTGFDSLLLNWLFYFLFTSFIITFLFYNLPGETFLMLKKSNFVVSCTKGKKGFSVLGYILSFLPSYSNPMFKMWKQCSFQVDITLKETDNPTNPAFHWSKF